MLRAMGASVVAMVLVLVIGPAFIRWLRLNEFGQNIREEGPEGHKTKEGTPTMGGVLIWFAVLVAYLVFSRFSVASLTVFVAAAGNALIGFADDWIKIVRKRSLGLSARYKLLLQLLLSLFIGFVALHFVGVTTAVDVPFTSFKLELGQVGFYALIFLTLAGFSNAVNLTDGLDGLAAGASAIVLVALAGIAFIIGRNTMDPGITDLMVIAGCVGGAALGFLWYNTFPADVFMGDTGSLGLGGAVAGMAVMTRHRAGAPHHRRPVRDRGRLRGRPGHLVQAVQAARAAHGAVTPPLRAQGLVRDQDHRALLDRGRHLRGRRVRGVLRDLLREGRWSSPTCAASPCSACAGAAGRRRCSPAVSCRRRGSSPSTRAPRRTTTPSQVLEAAGVEVLTGPAAVLPEDAGLLVKSPGVPDSSAAVQEALRRGVPLWSEVEFACRFLPNPVVGITGTNGKTTTTELTGAILRGARLPVAVGGNIGHALAAMPGEIAGGRDGRRRALELPARAHRALPAGRGRAPQPDGGPPRPARHLPRLRGRQAARVRAPDRRTTWRCSAPTTRASSRSGRPGGSTGAARRGWFSAVEDVLHGPGGEELVAGVEDDVLWVRIRGELRRLCRRDELALRGDHNVLNSLAAAAAACAAGAPVGAAADTLRTFGGVPHRLQVGDVVGGVTYVNDSKATNVDATLKALTAYSGGVHLILGGYDKGSAFDELAAATEGRVREVLLIGATAPALEAAFAARAAAAPSQATPYVVCGDLVGRRQGRARGGRAGRRRPAQPGLRELGPVQGL